MPQTDAELTAFRWGQEVGHETLDMAPGYWVYDGRHHRGMTDAELAAWEKLGLAAFRYWARRGADSPTAGR